MDSGFTSEQIEQLRASMGMGSSTSAGAPPNSQGAPSMQQAPMPTQQAPMSAQQAPIQQQQPQQRPSAQEAMKARMQASKSGAPTTPPVLMEQGENYNPVQSAPINQTAPQEQQTAAANRTIINTTQGTGSGDVGNMGDGQGGEEPKEGKGFKINPAMAIIIAVVAVLAVFFIFNSGKSKNPGDDEPTFEDPFNDPNIEWVTPDTGSFYTADQKQQLRAAGYTGDEIEGYAVMQTPYAQLIREADAARDAYIQSAIAPLYDTASDEYKHYISQTWLTLPKREDFPEWTNIAMNYTKRENLDYEKIDVYGNQLFIKVYLDDNEHKNWFFCSVTPDEWNRLGPAGNIIVNYVYTTRYVGDDIWTAVEDTENICIISSNIEFVN